MRFNQSHSYRWVSQPRKFSGQTLEWRSHGRGLTLEDEASVIATELPKTGFFSEVLMSFQTTLQQFRQQLQNS